MRKKVNPALDVSEGEVGSATASWPHPDLKPLRDRPKKGSRYLLHVWLCDEFEAPKSERWARRTVTVRVIGRGRGWVDECALTYDYLTTHNDKFEPVRPPGAGWIYEGPVAPRSSSWRRRREVA